MQSQGFDPLCLNTSVAPQHAQYGLQILTAWGCTSVQVMPVRISLSTTLRLILAARNHPLAWILTSAVFGWIGSSRVIRAVMWAEENFGAEVAAVVVV